jgi:hypothetical protein
LPANATWKSVSVDPIQQYRALEECAYECSPGFYHHEYDINSNSSGDQAGCRACNTSRVCEPGRRLTPCTQWADSHCDVECTDEQKPRLYSHWLAGSNSCEWACDDGKTLAVTSYVIFTLRECL